MAEVQGSFSESIMILQQASELMSPASELENVSTAAALMDDKDKERVALRDIAKEDLRALSLKLEQSKKAAKRPKNTQSFEEYQATLTQQEATQIDLGKKVNVEGLTIAEKLDRLVRLKEEWEELENKDVEKEAMDEVDGTTIRLKIYHDLGFTPLRDSTTGNVEKIIVRRDAKGQEDVHSIPLDPTVSKAFLANRLWSLAGDQ